MRATCLSSLEWVNDLTDTCLSSLEWVNDLRATCLSSLEWVNDLRATCLSSLEWVNDLRATCLSSLEWVSEMRASCLSSLEWANDLSHMPFRCWSSWSSSTALNSWRTAWHICHPPDGGYGNPNSSTSCHWMMRCWQQVKSTLIARLMGQHGVHLGPIGLRWAPCWPHEFCFLGIHTLRPEQNGRSMGNIYICSQKGNLEAIHTMHSFQDICRAN